MIELESLKSRLEYEPLTGYFRWLTVLSKARNVKVGDIAGTRHPEGYIKIKVGGRLFAAHRLAWLFTHGEWPSHVIDHINGVRDDNRIANLRNVVPAVNSQNRKGANSNSRTGLIGVSKHRQRFRASIWNGKNLERFGPFDTPEEAHAAYLTAKRVFHSEAAAVYPARGQALLGA